MKTLQEMAEEYRDSLMQTGERVNAFDAFIAGYQAAQPTNIVLKSATERPPEKVLLLPDSVIPIQDTDDIDWEQQLAAFSAYMDECQKRILQLEDSNSSKKLDNWISVKDRLPEERIWVLGYYSRFTDEKSFVVGLVQRYVHWYTGANCWMTDIKDSEISYEEVDVITHWMPLPEPPENKK